jgi:integrase
LGEPVAGSMRLVRGKDTWELRVFVGRDDQGRVRHRYTTFRGSRQAAQRALAHLVVEAQDADPDATTPRLEAPAWGPRATINDALEGWQRNGWEDLSPSTTRRYESIWKAHIRDDIGRSRIASLSPYDVEQFFRRLKGGGLSKASVRQVRAVLHRACRLARRWSSNTLPNPIADTELPTWQSDQAPFVRSPTASEVRVLLDKANDEDLRLGTFLRVITATGMRRGEACALRWSDVDVPNATLTINEGIVAAAGGAVVKRPKTRASIRKLAVDAGTLARLAELRDEQSALASACNLDLDPQGFVFSTEPGGTLPPYPDTFSHGFSRVRKLADVATDIHLHSLRHFHATALDPIISEAQKQARLGWADERRTTSASYSMRAVPATARRTFVSVRHRRSSTGVNIWPRSIKEPFDRRSGDSQPPTDREEGQRQLAPLDRPVERRPARIEEFGRLLDAQ